MELKAELAKKSSEFKIAKAAGTHSKPPSSKSKDSLDTRPAKKAKESPKSVQEEDLWEKSRAKLEEKTRIYEMLQRGDDEQVSESFKDNLLVDFNRQFHENKEAILAKAKLDDTRTTQPVEFVEYEDEFGRTRRMPKVEHDEQLLKEQADQLIEQMKLQSFKGHGIPDDYNDGCDPVYFDDTKEIRTKGVGFYRFSQSEGERQRQLEELGSLRKDTVETRTKTMILAEQRRLMRESRLEKVKERRAKLAEALPKEDCESE